MLHILAELSRMDCLTTFNVKVLATVIWAVRGHEAGDVMEPMLSLCLACSYSSSKTYYGWKEDHSSGLACGERHWNVAEPLHSYHSCKCSGARLCSAVADPEVFT